MCWGVDDWQVTHCRHVLRVFDGVLIEACSRRNWLLWTAVVLEAMQHLWCLLFLP